MATYRIMSWRGIPAQVKASEPGGKPVSVALPPWFQHEIDRVAMREGIAESDAYLDAWTWSPDQERPGTADEVASAVAAELIARWGRTA